MKKVFANLLRFTTNRKGQGLVEYALILLLIAIVVIAMITGIGTNLNTTYETINSSVANAGK